MARLTFGAIIRLRFILSTTAWWGLAARVGQVDVIDVAVPNRTVIGDHPVADNRRSPVIVDNGSPVDIRDPDTGVAVHAVEAAPRNDNRMAGVSQPADADSVPPLLALTMKLPGPQ